MREWLKAIRISHGMSAADTAAALGMDRDTYMLTEQGIKQRSMDMNLAVKLARLFGISLDLIACMETGNTREQLSGNR